MIIAISGPAAAGKGTLARMLSRKIGLPHYDFGLMYRAIALIESKCGLNKIEILARRKCLQVRSGNVHLRWVNLTPILFKEEIGLEAAKLASVAPEQMARIAQSMVQHENFVCDGRTCGIEIYPDADHKFHITADGKERLGRRMEYDNKEEFFLTRESLDRTRMKTSPLAIVIDTTGKTEEESLKELLSHLKNPTLTI